MQKLKLATILGTRPEIIRLSAVIKLADRVFDHILIHTGQNYAYTLGEIFFEDLCLKAPDYYLDAVGSDLGATIGNIIAKSYTLLAELRPDAVLILGDTNSALAAISAKRLKIPVFHMEAGNRCFDENLPEELNRRIVDHISDVNLPYSEQARRNLLAEGLKREYTFVTGSPMREVLQSRRPSDVLSRLGLEPQKYILLSAHREENIDNEHNFGELAGAINGLAEKYNMPVLYSVHPRSQKAIDTRGVSFHPLVRTHEPFGFSDFIALQENAFCVVSDSGTLAEESAILGFPAVSARTSTERQEAIDRGGMIVGGIGRTAILQAVEMATALKDAPRADVPDYDDENVSIKVCKIIQGYTDVINRMIWRKM
ncbi:MAG: UDP-N-acetylglucosamine 2-epimerase (non-hydrolyzing) [Oscillospiraceae bacterium]|nr:UDP-N-acetylglucosamine 2-epimerase (non-hydrolyzing) [Oscillospiraceae bacterium]